MLWFTFVGSWLLVAGALLQAVLELREQGIDRGAVLTATGGIGRGPRPSSWWWLIPPVMLVRRRRRSRRFWQAAFAALPEEDVAQIEGIRPRTYGWSLVTLGGACLATSETWRLAEHFDWPLWLFLVILVLLAGLAVVNAMISTSQGGKTHEHR
jgi:hypothetical protein